MPVKQYWLVKSEPDAFSIDALAKKGKTCWDGVRNYQARNYIRDQMAIGDGVLFYHSNADPTGVAGVAEVCSKAYPDPTAWDPKHDHFDPKTKKDAPAWMMVDIKFEEKFAKVVTLDDLRANAKLADMLVLKRGQRLSVQPVTKAEFEEVLRMGRSAK
jgi:predicted RNA-binding protein with PUA-like domain